MPIIKSAKKRLRTSLEARDRNVGLRTRVKSARRKMLEAASAGDAAAGTAAFRAYCSVLDNAAKKGIIAKNTAVRRKTRAAEKIRGL